MNEPLVSVIVPNYNHSAYLMSRIDSILAQDFDNFELILLDDCSTDNSRDILLKYQSDNRVTHIVLMNKIVVRLLNNGIRACF